MGRWGDGPVLFDISAVIGLSPDRVGLLSIISIDSLENHNYWQLGTEYVLYCADRTLRSEHIEVMFRNGRGMIVHTSWNGLCTYGVGDSE